MQQKRTGSAGTAAATAATAAAAAAARWLQLIIRLDVALLLGLYFMIL